MKNKLDSNIFIKNNITKNTSRKFLQTISQRYDAYNNMMQDPRVYSLYKLRRDKILEHGYSFSYTQNSEVNDYVMKHFDDKFIRKISKNLLQALAFGFRPIELIWQQNSKNKWFVKDFFCPDILIFNFDEKGKLCYKKENNQFESLDYPMKFLIHRNEGSSDDNPWGESVLAPIYWACMLKNKGLDFWIEATKKFGVPSLVALFDTDDENTASQRAEFLSQALGEIENGSSSSFYNIRDIKTIDMSGSLEDYRSLVEFCNTEISIGLTGQSLATGEGFHSSKAQAVVHNSIFDDMIENDARSLAYTIQKIVNWGVELNFKNQEAPQYNPVNKKIASWQTLMEAKNNSIPISKETVYNLYGIPKPLNDDDIL